MMFDFKDFNLHISNIQDNYAKEYRKNISMQNKYAQQLREKYTAYGNMDNAIKNLSDDMLKLFVMAAQEYVDYWLDQKVYTINLQVFLSEYVGESATDSLDMEDALQAVEDAYAQIVLVGEKKEQYNQQRKASRPRFCGGGFGISGMLKGAITAEAINVATGLGYSVLNSIEKIPNSIFDKEAKKKLYENEEVIDSLVEALECDILGLLKYHLAIAEQSTEIVYEYPDSDDAMRAKVTLQNIMNRDIPADEEKEMIPELFRANPYEEDIYIYLFKKHGDSEFELESIADYFGCKKEVIQAKDQCLTEIYENAPKDTFEQNKELLHKIKNAIKHYGIKSEYSKKIVKELGQRYQELYNKACTWKGVVYKTPKDREVAETEETEISKILESVNHNNITSLEEAVSKIEKVNCTIYKKSSVLTKLKMEILNLKDKSDKEAIDSILRTLDKNNLDSINKAKEKINSLSIQSNTKASTLHELDECINKIHTEQETKVLKDIVKNINYYDLSSIENAYEKIQGLEFKYISKQETLDKLKTKINNFDRDVKMFKGYECKDADEAQRMRELRNQGLELLNKNDYVNAIKLLNQCPTPELERLIKKEFQARANDKMKYIIEAAKENVDSSFLQDIGIWTGFDIVIIIIDKILSAIFNPIRIVFHIIAIILIIMSIDIVYENKKKRKAKKEAIKELTALNNIGYNFDIE